MQKTGNGKKRATGASGILSAEPARRTPQQKRQDYYALIEANEGCFLDPTDGDFSKCKQLKCQICSLVGDQDVFTQKSVTVDGTALTGAAALKYERHEKMLSSHNLQKPHREK